MGTLTLASSQTTTPKCRRQERTKPQRRALGPACGRPEPMPPSCPSTQGFSSAFWCFAPKSEQTAKDHQTSQESS